MAGGVRAPPRARRRSSRPRDSGSGRSLATRCSDLECLLPASRDRAYRRPQRRWSARGGGDRRQRYLPRQHGDRLQALDRTAQRPMEPSSHEARPSRHSCQRANGWPELQLGGPGFCFPVLRWNGTAFTSHRHAYEGKPAVRSEPSASAGAAKLFSPPRLPLPAISSGRELLLRPHDRAAVPLSSIVSHAGPTP